MLHLGSTVFIGLIGVIMRLYFDISAHLGFVEYHDIPHTVQMIPNLLIITTFFLIYLSNKNSEEGRSLILPVLAISVLSFTYEILLFLYIFDIHLFNMGIFMWVMDKLRLSIDISYCVLFLLLWSNKENYLLKLSAGLNLVTSGLRVADLYYGPILFSDFYMILHYSQNIFLGLFFLAAYSYSLHQEREFTLN